MPVHVRLGHDSATVIATYHGWVTGEDLLAGYDAVRKLTDGRTDGFQELMDLTGVQGTDVTGHHIERVLARPALFGAGCHRAILAPGDLTFGFARMFELRREGSSGEIKACRSVDEALRWLGLDADPRE